MVDCDTSLAVLVGATEDDSLTNDMHWWTTLCGIKDDTENHNMWCSLRTYCPNKIFRLFIIYFLNNEDQKVMNTLGFI